VLQGNGFNASSNLRVLFGDSENSLTNLTNVIAVTRSNGTFSIGLPIPIGPYTSQPDANSRFSTFIRISDSTGLSTGTEPFVGVNMQSASLLTQPERITANAKLTIAGLAVSENGAPLANANLGFLTLRQPNGTETTVSSQINGLTIVDQIGSLQSDNSVLSDSAGRVKVSFIVPSVDGGTAEVKFTAVQELKADFEILPKLQLSVDGAKPGETITVVGSSYRSEDVISVSLDGTKIDTTPSIIKTDKRGSFEAEFVIPLELPGGSVTIVATDSGVTDAKQTPTIASQLTILGILDTPVEGAQFRPGDTINVTGKGLNANETAVISIGGVIITDQVFTTEANGSYDFSLTMPSLSGGAHKIRVSASTNVAEGGISITSTPITISPTEGSVGTKIDIQGSGYQANAPISVSIGFVEDVTFGNVSATGEVAMEYIISRPQSPGEKTLTINIGDEKFYKGFNYQLDAEGPAILKATHDGGTGVISKVGQVVIIKAIQRDDFDIAKRGTYKIGDPSVSESIDSGDLYNDGTHQDEGANDAVWAIPYQVPAGVTTKVDGLPSSVPVQLTLFDALGNATTQETDIPIQIDTVAEIKKLNVSGTGKYKVGDKLTITVVGEENCSGTFQIAGVTGKEPLVQGMFANQYRASYTFRGGDRALNAKLIIELTDSYGNVTTQNAEKTITIEEVLQLNRVSLPTRLHGGDRFSVEFFSSSEVTPSLSISDELLENPVNPEEIEYNWKPITLLQYRALEPEETASSLVSGLTVVEAENMSDDESESEEIMTHYIAFARIPADLLLSSRMRLVRLMISDKTGKSQTAEIPVDFYGVSSFTLDVPVGISMIHLPLAVTAVNNEKQEIKTVGDLYQVLGGAQKVNLLITYDHRQNAWSSYLGELNRNSQADRIIEGDTGIITVLKEHTTLQLYGRSLGDNGVGTISLQKGLNHVGIPVKNHQVNTVSDLFALDGFKDNATAIIVPDQGKFKVVAAKGDDGDIPIVGGQSFIVTAKRSSQVQIGGLAWSNAFQSKVNSAPSILTQNGTPLLVINGRLTDEESQSVDEEISFTVQRLNSLSTNGSHWTNQSIFDLSAKTRLDGYFSATQISFQPEGLLSVNDVLEVEVALSNKDLRVRPIVYQVTREDLQNGFIMLPDLVAYQVPKYSELGHNYPNPFNPETWIPYQIATDSQVELKIYSSSGQLVRTIEIGYQTAGHYVSRQRAIYWDGCNDVGEPIGSGIYFYVLRLDSETENRIFSKKMTIVK
ncbi:hypothetical protein CMK20_16670, partial [Candidatus Poribacteria bacterium]|nr:hypothetical protein [Candidatus Poribacteria bacterium]